MPDLTAFLLLLAAVPVGLLIVAWIVVEVRLARMRRKIRKIDLEFVVLAERIRRTLETDRQDIAQAIHEFSSR